MSATQIKLILVGIYASIGLLFAVYQHFWGYYNDKSFAYNLGQGVVWPAVMFPVVGQVIGGVIMIAVIGYIVMKSK
ncbi:MAG: hypothetical protein VXW65_04185 [Pseudomonadota bacterium]|nr:hypothetical protein [Pseudomonadota bacterium]